MNVFVLNVCSLFKNFSRIIHQWSSHVSIDRLKPMEIKGLLESFPKHFPDLEEPRLICILAKATKIPRGPTIDVSKFLPGFMLQMGSSFFNVESIRGFTLNFVAICYATSYPFGFPSRRKCPPLDILKCFFHYIG